MLKKLNIIVANTIVRWVFGLCLSIFIAILAMVALFRQTDYGQLLAVGRQISLPFLVLAIVCYGTTWVVRTRRLRLLLSFDLQNFSLWSLYRAQVAGFAINSLLPAKLGEVALVAFLRSAGFRGSGALAAVFQARLFDVLALMTMMIISGIALLGKSSVPWHWSILFIVLFLVLLPMFLVIFDRQHLLEKWLTGLQQKKGKGRLQKFLGKISETLKAYRAIVADRRLFVFSFIQSLLLWFGEIMVTGLVCLAVGVPSMYFSWLFLAVPLGNVGKAFPITPGGIGVYEAITAATLASAGLQWEFAVIVGIIDHLLKKSWTVAWGVSFVVGQVKSSGWKWLHRGGVLLNGTK